MNKRGFLRILEVMIAITFLTIAVLYVYVNKAPTNISIEEYMHNYHKEILSRIATDTTLRTYALQENEVSLEQSVFLPENLNFSIRICDITTVVTSCNLEPDIAAYLFNADVLEVYADETIIASNLSHYDPKKVKLYIWENTL